MGVCKWIDGMGERERECFWYSLNNNHENTLQMPTTAVLMWISGNLALSAKGGSWVEPSTLFERETKGLWASFHGKVINGPHSMGSPRFCGVYGECMLTWVFWLPAHSAAQSSSNRTGLPPIPPTISLSSKPFSSNPSQTSSWTQFKGLYSLRCCRACSFSTRMPNKISSPSVLPPHQCSEHIYPRHRCARNPSSHKTIKILTKLGWTRQVSKVV